MGQLYLQNMMDVKIIILCFIVIVEKSRTDKLPEILWDPRNVLFGCDVKINVEFSDELYFTCPDGLVENMYFLENEDDFNNCDASSTSKSKKVFDCKTKCQTLQALKIRTDQSQQTDPVFERGKTYYLIGTGNGKEDGLSNKIGGRCSPNPASGFHRLRMTIHVCAKDDTTCKPCRTAACYENGCGTFSAWDQQIGNFTKQVDDDITCFNEETRTCNSKLFQCNSGQLQRFQSAVCPIKPSPSVTFTTVTQNVTVNIQANCSTESVYSVPCSTVVLTVNRTVNFTEHVNRTVMTTVIIPETLSPLMVTTTVLVSAVDCGSVTPAVEVLTVTATPAVRVETVTVKGDCTAVPCAIFDGRRVYSNSFYITMACAIIGALCVGLFGLHACVLYKRSTVSHHRRKKRDLTFVEPFNADADGENTVKSGEISGSSKQNGDVKKSLIKTESTYVTTFDS